MLTDRDAAAAAQFTIAARNSSTARPWELYRSEPVNPRRRPPDPSDAKLSLDQAELDGTGRREPAEGRKAGPGYGTGPAYDPSRMRPAR